MFSILAAALTETSERLMMDDVRQVWPTERDGDDSHQVRLGFSLESPEDSEEHLILSGDLEEEGGGLVFVWIFQHMLMLCSKPLHCANGCSKQFLNLHPTFYSRTSILSDQAASLSMLKK